MLLGFVSRLRAIILPKTIPEHLRKPLIAAPVQSNDIWDVPSTLLSPALDAINSAKTSGQFFRGRGRAARGSSFAASGSGFQQPGRGRGGRGRGHNNRGNRRNRNKGAKKPTDT